MSSVQTRTADAPPQATRRDWIGLGVLALALGYWLSTAFELPRLNLYYLVAGVLALWIISLAAALWPARRASMVSPAVATRTV